ncbi:MAG TPA: transposase [Glycomyces sp.]|nr:transposase [Glycomyces sp.]
MVFNDAVAARRVAFAAGEAYPSTAVLSQRLITEAKATPDRAWLGEVSAVVLQQALADCDRAYTNFFASAGGKRAGARIGPPRFKKRTAAQAIRFTRNARFRVLGNGRLRLPKVGDLKVAWSRELPSDPSSVTVMKTATGKYYVSFVVSLGRDETLPSVGSFPRPSCARPVVCSVARKAGKDSRSANGGANAVRSMTVTATPRSTSFVKASVWSPPGRRRP